MPDALRLDCRVATLLAMTDVGLGPDGAFQLSQRPRQPFRQRAGRGGAGASLLLELEQGLQPRGGPAGGVGGVEVEAALVDREGPGVEIADPRRLVEAGAARGCGGAAGKLLDQAEDLTQLRDLPARIGETRGKIGCLLVLHRRAG